MKKLPHSLSICGKIWLVKSEPDLKDDGEPLRGLTTCEDRVIRIDSLMNWRDQWVTFLHELNHAIIFELGGHTAALSDDLEEILVEGIARQYAEIFVMRTRDRGSATSRATKKARRRRRRR